MRIAFVSTLKGSAWGGSEELWASACSAALTDGHEVLVSRYAWDETPAKLAALALRGAKMVYRPRRPNKIARLFPRPSWLREIEAFKPEVVCISQGGAYECAGHRSMRPLVKWLKRNSVPLVNLIQFNSADASLGSAAAEVARALYERASVNAFVAMDNAIEASRRLGVEVPRVKVVVNPVNLKDTSALDWPMQGGGGAEHQEHAHFACVGRLDARTKGQDALLHILGEERWRERSWTLSLFGHGPDDQRYREMARELKIDDRVQFRGHVDDIREVWREHHALVLPSRAEGTPLAMMEAMVLGRPALVCDVGGCRDWIRSSEQGEVTPGELAASAKAEHLGPALERFWEQRHRWVEMGALARQRALEFLKIDPGRAFLDVLVQAGPG